MIQQTSISISTPDGEMPAFLCMPTSKPKSGILLLMEAFGVTTHIQNVATQIAQAGYVVLTPDLYYRVPHTSFTYEEVDQAMAMMWQLDFGKPIEQDIHAALLTLKSFSDLIGVTGFCLGGGLSFLTACKFSAEITVAASFYGMVLDEWIEAVQEITVPVYLFFGGQDRFIGRDRIEQIESRFQALKKDYRVKIYPDAGHGFFCNERSDYNPLAAAEAWSELLHCFDRHLNH